MFQSSRNRVKNGSNKRIYKRNSKENVMSKSNTAIQATASLSKANVLIPAMDTAFKAFVSARFCSAIWAYITDCDEVYNYWEPLHFLLYGHGLQTWEYSPQYALRSYTYLMLHGVPAWLYDKAFHPSPILIFYFIRCILGLFCATVECYFYKAVCREFGIHVGRIWLIFQLFSVGMFISSTALLPSSFSMYFGSIALASWWHKNYKLAVFSIAISSLLGWPFAALIGLPIAFDMLIRQNLYKTFFLWSLISAMVILIPMILIDSKFYGKLTIAPLNIIKYNVFSQHGPNLYGTENMFYYLINGFLNFNLAWIFAMITPLMIVTDKYFIPAKSKSTLNFPYMLSLSPLYLWLVVFFLQPHKEERFLFPIYPLISLCGAITLDIIQKIIYAFKENFLKYSKCTHYLDHTMFIALITILVSIIFGLSRTFALYKNYHAPMDLLIELNEFRDSKNFQKNQIYNVCIGKDWHRYPTSFFFPSLNFRIRFLKSEFQGILPAYYSSEKNASAIIHSYFNDRNQENQFMYFDYKKCHFLLDLDIELYTEIEPNYSAKTKEWVLVKSVPFLDPQKSNRFFRAFYFPFINDFYVKYGNFNLLRRKKFK